MKYYSPWSGEVNVTVTLEYFRGNNRPCLYLWDEEGPYGNLGVNLPDNELDEECMYVDVNNMPNAELFLEENGLGEPTGDFGFSGFCMYPVYKLNMERINELVNGGK